MSLKPFLALCALAVGLGCSLPLHVYPIQGPLAQQRPGLVLEGRISGLLSGSTEIRLPSGETCRGSWARVLQNSEGAGERTEWGQTWDAVYGQGYFVAHVLGSGRRGRAMLQGDQGSQIALEFYTEAVKGSPVLGVARDGSGNVYKMAI